MPRTVTKIDEVKKGINLLRAGLKTNTAEAPILYELYYHLANAFAKQKKIEQAIKNYRKAIAQPITAKLKLGAYNNWGNLLQIIGDFPKASKIYETTIEIEPNFALGYYNLGMTLKAMGLFIQAIAVYEQAIKLNPNYAYAYQNLGVVLLKIGKIPEATQQFKQAIALHQQQNPSEATKLRQGLAEIGIKITNVEI